MGTENQLPIIRYKNKKSGLEQKVLKDMLLDLGIGNNIKVQLPEFELLFRKEPYFRAEESRIDYPPPSHTYKKTNRAHFHLVTRGKNACSMVLGSGKTWKPKSCCGVFL